MFRENESNLVYFPYCGSANANADVPGQSDNCHSTVREHLIENAAYTLWNVKITNP